MTADRAAAVEALAGAVATLVIAHNECIDAECSLRHVPEAEVDTLLDAILANPDYRAALLAVLDDGRLARAEAVVEAARAVVAKWIAQDWSDSVWAPDEKTLRAALAAHDTEAGSDE